MHGMSGMIPGQCRAGLIAFVIERQIAFDFFVRFARIVVKPFIARAIRSYIIFVFVARFHKRLLFVVFSPIFFFFSCWIHSFCHSMRTVGRGDTADHCSNCRAYRSADRRPEGGTSNSFTGCSHTGTYWMRTRLTRDRVGIFPRFFLHSVGPVSP